MSLHTRCPQRIASTYTYRTLCWQRGVRCYASNAANDSEWFEPLRSEMLGRTPIYQHEDIDLVHHRQLLITLGGFVPRNPKKDALAHLLTHFNLQVPSAKLLPDGTDPLHSPGEPWMRRMWAGGAVKLNPSVSHKFDAFRLQPGVACLERIKDVRLQGGEEEDTAKIFVTIERRFASVAQLVANSGSLDARSYMRQQVRDGVEWGEASVKEERKLVFLKAKTDAELVAVQAGHTLVPRYLTSPTDPDFTHTLTPSRSLLFRYSALTFNAHLLHLDPTYARNVEGHRNLLVQGPLTLTLILQTLTQRLHSSSEFVQSVEYRNLAPLYCDEEMRVCVKKKRGESTGNVWDVWIEGPTGGMAVKAFVHTLYRRRPALPAQKAVEAAASTGLSDVQTAARQAQGKLSALDRSDSTSEQLSQLSREERRKLWRKEKRYSGTRALSYLYSASSPLVVRFPSPAPQADPGPAASSPTSSTPILSSAQKQRKILLRASESRKPLQPSGPTATDSSSKVAKDTNPRPKIRSIKTQGPEDVLSITNFQKTTDSQASSERARRLVVRPLAIKKIEHVTVRKIDVGMGDVKKQGKSKLYRMRKALKKAALAAEGRARGAGGTGESVWTM